MWTTLAEAVVITPSLSDSRRAYVDQLGYREVWRGPTPDDGPDNASGLQGAPAMTLASSSGHPFRLHLIEDRSAEPAQAFAVPGWAALELVVADLHGLAARLDKGVLPWVGPPRRLELSFTDKISAMQVRGPAGELLYLTEIAGETPGFALPRAKSEVDQVFAAILGVSELDRSAAWWAETLGQAVPKPIASRVTGIAQAYGLGDDARHQLATFPLRDEALIELDQLPPQPALQSRPQPQPRPRAGLAGVTLTGRGGGEARHLRGPDGESLTLKGA